MKRVFIVFFCMLMLTASLCFNSLKIITFAEELTTVEEKTTSEKEESTAEESTTEESTTEEIKGTLVLLGDVDGSAVIEANDAREILRASVGLSLFEAEIFPVADINYDGVIGADDARLALRMSVSLEETISHMYLITAKNEATCKKEGNVSFYCTDCSFSGKVTLPLKSHNYMTLINISPSCTNDGFINKVCSVCAKISNSVPQKLGHNWKKTSATVATTCTRCSRQKTGWEKYNGKYYYFYEQNRKSVLAVNRIVDGFYVDVDGVRVDDEVIKLAVSFVEAHSSSEDKNEKRLEDCYNYLYKNFNYKTMYGIPATKDMAECAKYMFTNHNGNCYRYASTFAYIARVLGYDSRVILGKVRGVYGDMVNHSYTEVFVDGKWLICDASQNTAYGQYDWYLCTQENYPKTYSRESTATLTVKNGKVTWS